MSDRNIQEFEPSGGFTEEDNTKLERIKKHAKKKKLSQEVIEPVMRAYFRRTYPDEFKKWDKGRLLGRIKRVQGEGVKDL